MPVITTNGRARARQLEMNLKRKQAIKKANQQANSNTCGCVPCGNCANCRANQRAEQQAERMARLQQQYVNNMRVIEEYEARKAKQAAKKLDEKLKQEGNKLVHIAVECTKKTVATIVNGHPLMVADIVTMIFTLEELAQRGLGLIIKDYGITAARQVWIHFKMGGEVKRENSHTPDDMKYIKDCFQHALNNTSGWSYVSGGASDEYRICGTKSLQWLTPNGSASRATLQTLGLNKPPKDPILKASFMTVAASMEAPNDTAKRKNAEEAIKNVKVIHTPPEDDPEGKKFKKMAAEGIIGGTGDDILQSDPARERAIAQENRQAQNQLRQGSILPQSVRLEAEKLLRAASEKNIGLTLVAVGIADEQLTVEYDLSPTTKEMAESSDEKKTVKDLRNDVVELARMNANWQVESSTNLIFKTNLKIKKLKANKKPSEEFLQQTGINLTTATGDTLKQSYRAVEMAVIAWFEKLSLKPKFDVAKSAKTAAEFLKGWNDDAARKILNWLKTPIVPGLIDDADKIAARARLESLVVLINQLLEGDQSNWYHNNFEELARFDRWFNIVPGEIDRSIMPDLELIRARLTIIRDRAEAMTAIATDPNWPHYRVKGFKQLFIEGRVDAEATSPTAAAHVRGKREVFELYLDRSKKIIARLNNTRVMFFDLYDKVIKESLDALIIHEWVHVANRLDGIVVRNLEGDRSAHVTLNELDLEESDSLTFEQAFINPSSWFSYITNAHEQDGMVTRN